MPPRKWSVSLKVFSLILFWDLLTSLAELSFKAAASAAGMPDVTTTNLLEFLTRVLSHAIPWIGIACYLASFLLWIAILSRVDLSFAYPIGNVIDYVLVPVLSVMILHETIPLLRWVGIGCIVIGVYLISTSAAQSHDA